MKALGLLCFLQALCLNGRTSKRRPVETSCVPVVRSIALLAKFCISSWSLLTLNIRIATHQTRFFFGCLYFEIRMHLLEFRMRLMEVRMVLSKARIISLHRGYLSVNEPNLRSNFILLRVCVNHPVEFVNVLLESHNEVCRDLRVAHLFFANVPRQVSLAGGGK